MSRQQTRTETVLMYCSPETKSVLHSCKGEDETFDDVIARVEQPFDPDKAPTQEVQR